MENLSTSMNFDPWFPDENQYSQLSPAFSSTVNLELRETDKALRLLILQQAKADLNAT